MKGANFGKLGGRPKNHQKPPKTPNGDTETPKTPDSDSDSDSDSDLKKENILKEKNKHFLEFETWIKQNAKFCSNPKNMQQLSEEEFLKLKETYTSQQIADTVRQLENRKDLRKKYSNLYRTLLNWLKNGKTED